MLVRNVMARVPLYLSFAGLVCVQSGALGWVDTRNQQTEKQIELAKEQYEKLRKADFAKLELARPPLELNQKPEELTRPLKAGDGIHFRVLITNTSNDPVGVPIGDNYRQTRPVLVRGGDLVPYKKRINELITKLGDEPVFTFARGTHIDPGSTITTNIDMKDWYAPLKPGHYELKVRMRFIWDGTWVESSAITFEVEADSLDHNRPRVTQAIVKELDLSALSARTLTTRKGNEGCRE